MPPMTKLMMMYVWFRKIKYTRSSNSAPPYHMAFNSDNLVISLYKGVGISNEFSIYQVLEEERKMLSVIKSLALVSFLVMFPVIQGWGDDGHIMVCRIAQPLLSEAAASGVKDLLPAYADNDLGSLCTWADHIKRQNRQYRWSSPLHYIDTPDNLCNYEYARDCKDGHGEKDRCVVGAINNYTAQLLTYSSSSTKYNLTEALLFLSHYMGDIHQPLHVGFTSDGGANTIKVHWYGLQSNLHHVWDDNIIDTAEERFYGTNVNEFINAIQKNITDEWANEVSSWESCSRNETTCPDIYASESNKAACAWAYKGVSQGSTLEDDYFFTRLPVVNLRLAQGGVRLAATLNRIFSDDPSNLFFQSVINLNQSFVNSI